MWESRVLENLKWVVWHRSPKPMICLSVCDIPKKEKKNNQRTSNVDVSFILTLQRSALMAVGPCKRGHTSSSLRFTITVPRQRQNRSRWHKPTCGLELYYISVYVQKEKVQKQSRDKKPLPKGDKEGVTIHSQNNTQSFWPEAPWPGLITGGGRSMYWPHK